MRVSVLLSRTSARFEHVLPTATTMNQQRIDLARSTHLRHKSTPADQQLSLDVPGSSSLAAWFLGPKAENEALFLELLQEAFQAHCQSRKDYAPGDPVFVTDEIRETRSFRHSEQTLRKDLDLLLQAMRGSIPLASYRNQSHMYWDITMPAALGYFTGMLYNQNNVTVEASPVTTFLEMLVGDDLCTMLGYSIPSTEDAMAGTPRPWGHITCDGSVANLESMWSARNLKYYPISVAAALRREAEIKAARDIEIELSTGRSARLIDLDDWTLLNLNIDSILDLAIRIVNDFGITNHVLDAALGGYILQNLGFPTFNQRFLSDRRHHVPAVLAPSTAHYSWPKAAALLGIGAHCVRSVHVDLDARMDLGELRRHLDECLETQTPVLQVVAVIGSTEESAVDPLADIVELRNEYRLEGLDFALHADGAWGGYFASMLRPDPYADILGGDGAPVDREPIPELSMSRYVTRQYEALGLADTITVDPHKAGYIPYPAGGLCYRNSAMRTLVAFTAPVVYHGGIDPSVGVYGVEGSKPGAAAAGVYLSHRLIRPNQSGYGKLLEKCMWNSKRLYAAIATMAGDDDPFTVTTFQRLPSERAGEPDAKVREQLDFIRRAIVPRSNAALVDDEDAMALIKELGSDQIIVTYTFNFRTESGVNTDLARLAALNDAMFRSLSLHSYDPSHLGEVPATPLFITSSNFDPAAYGQSFVDSYARRLGVEATPGIPIPFLISTTMDPWITDVEPNDAMPDGNFIPTIIDALRTTARTIIANGEPFQPLTY
jgi:glutamate/tyrosine decarboxylase-like PLP-dependent enzyme